MKKSFLVLPFIALGLTACSTGSSESTTSAEVANAGAPAWQSPEVQSAPMPASMTQPTYQAPQPIQSVPQPSYGQPGYTQPQPMPQAPQMQMGGQAEMVGNCQVVRDGTNTPIYAQIQKGCYTDSSYTVGKHDTVFLIAYLSGKSVADIARLNNLAQPYQLKMGQVLRLK